MIFEAVEILVPFAARFALVRLFLLHAQGAFVRNGCLGIDDGEGAVCVIVQSLVVVTMLCKRPG